MMIEFLEVLGCSIVAFVIVVTIFEKENHNGKHEIHI